MASRIGEDPRPEGLRAGEVGHELALLRVVAAALHAVAARHAAVPGLRDAVHLPAEGHRGVAELLVHPVRERVRRRVDVQIALDPLEVRRQRLQVVALDPVVPRPDLEAIGRRPVAVGPVVDAGPADVVAVGQRDRAVVARVQPATPVDLREHVRLALIEVLLRIVSAPLDDDHVVPALRQRQGQGRAPAAAADDHHVADSAPSPVHSCPWRITRAPGGALRTAARSPVASRPEPAARRSRSRPRSRAARSSRACRAASATSPPARSAPARPAAASGSRPRGPPVDSRLNRSRYPYSSERCSITRSRTPDRRGSPGTATRPPRRSAGGRRPRGRTADPRRPGKRLDDGPHDRELLRGQADRDVALGHLVAAVQPGEPAATGQQQRSSGSRTTRPAG